MDNILKKLIFLYSKYTKIKKLKYFNEWRLKIIIKESYKDNYDNVHLRLYDDYKYKESYLETLRIFYQLKENGDYTFHPKINKEYNPYSITKLNLKRKDNKKHSRNESENYLQNHENTIDIFLKTFQLASKFSEFKENYKNKNKEKINKKEKKLISFFNSSISRNKSRDKLNTRNNTFSNLLYLKNIKTSNNSTIKISKIKTKKSRNYSHKKNNILFPSNTITNINNYSRTTAKSTINRVATQRIKSKSISLNLPQDDSLILKNITTKQGSKSKNNKIIKLPNFTKLLEYNNKNNNNNKERVGLNSPCIIYDNAWESNDNISTLKNSKDLKINEQKLNNTFSPKTQASDIIKPSKRNNMKQKLNLEEPLNEVELIHNLHNCIINTEDTVSSNNNNENINKLCINSNNLYINGIKQDSDRITIQTISDDKLLKHANCYLSSDVSLDNFIKNRKNYNKKNGKK